MLDSLVFQPLSPSVSSRISTPDFFLQKSRLTFLNYVATKKDMLYNMSLQYEKGPYNTGAGGGTADYIFALIFGITTLLVTYPLMTSFFRLPPLFCTNLVFFVMYLWSRRNPTAQSNIWGIPIPGVWLPFAYLALSVVIGSSYFDIIHGLAVGHIYYFLVDVVPAVQGREILVTPSFLVERFGIGQYRPQEETNANARPIPGGNPQPNMPNYNWGGTGRRLGRD
jgi:Der1-like family